MADPQVTRPNREGLRDVPYLRHAIVNKMVGTSESQALALVAEFEDRIRAAERARPPQAEGLREALDGLEAFFAVLHATYHDHERVAEMDGHVQVLRAALRAEATRDEGLRAAATEALRVLEQVADEHRRHLRQGDLIGAKWVKLAADDLRAALRAEATRDEGLDVERLAHLIDEVYQRGMDSPEAAEYIAAALRAEPPQAEGLDERRISAAILVSNLTVPDGIPVARWDLYAGTIAREIVRADAALTTPAPKP